MPSQARISPHWKEEVNQRLAAHKNRKPSPVVVEKAIAVREHQGSSKRASAAAARVAARFANAPSYGDLLVNEARAAVRVAEAASRAARQAQAVVESVLAELQAAKASQPGWQFDDNDDAVEEQAHSTVTEENDDQFTAGLLESKAAEWEQPVEENSSYEVLWEPDAPMHRAELAASNARIESTEWHASEPGEQYGAVEVVEADQPIHANLIQFPREIVATRKARPRRIEGPLASQDEPGAQLSIFEVIPEAISTEPSAAEPMNPAAMPSWMSPEWSEMELDSHPAIPVQHEAAFFGELIPEAVVDEEIYQAPFSLRLMAAVVDASLVAAATLVSGFEIATRLHSYPTMRATELGAAAALLIVSALYLALFYYFAKGTPGMRYAQIAFSTFDGRTPSRAEKLRRLAALLLSVLPVGVGVLWSIFDEDHLSWHDRLSRTYLRSY